MKLFDLMKIKKVRTPDGEEWTIRETYQRPTMIDIFGLTTALSLSELHELIKHGCFTTVTELVEIPIDDWEPQEGDIVEWANGERHVVRKAMLICIPGLGSTFNANHEDTQKVMKAAKCKIWRNQ